MNKFEIVLMFSPDLATNVLNSEINDFKSKLTSQSAKIVNEENWGLRDLSYSINKFKKAFYNFLQIEASGDIVKNLSKELNQSENLIRYIFSLAQQPAIKSISTDAPTAKPVTPIQVLEGSLSLGKYEAYTLFILSKSAKFTK